MKKNIYVVNHTHWDREWYFTTMDSLLLSDDVFSQAIRELSENPSAKFVLDGQTSILDEYMTLHPEQLEQVRQLVASGQLAIGPWYTQTDAFSVNEESFLRNLAIGSREARKYGREMEVGYLPDTFGFNAQMPTLLRAAGFDNIVFWRGMNFNTLVSSPYFIWQGLGDKSIKAANLVDGYGTAAFLNSSDSYIEERLLPSIKRIEDHTDNENLLIPAGGDQLKIVSHLSETLAEISDKTDYNLISSRYEDFLATLDSESMPSYRGEFREPVATRVHKTIGSVRYDIKKEVYDLEQLLLRHVEPLLAIAADNDIKISPKLLEVAWKKLLEGEAHDSLGGCVEDVVATDIIERNKQVRELAEGLENTIGKRLAEKMGLSSNDVIVFNTSTKPFSGYKTIDILSSHLNVGVKGDDTSAVISSEFFKGKDNLLLETPEGPQYINEDPYYRLHIRTHCTIPAMGFKVLQITEQEPLPLTAVAGDLSISQGTTTVSFSEGRLSLKHDNLLVEDFLTLEDEGNNGDTYDYSPLKGDKPITLRFDSATVAKTSVQQTLTLTGAFKLPKDLSQRLQDVPETKPVAIKLTISLCLGLEIPQFHLEIDNTVLDHRMRIKVNLADEAQNALASVPFGFLKRPINQEIPDNWDKRYVEYPIDVEPFDKSVSLQGNETAITAYAKGLKEYQVIGSSLYVTLMATTGQLGKPNLAYRPGRASGDTTKKGHVMIATPLAELEKKLTFDFAIELTPGKLNESHLSNTWREYTEPSISYQMQSLNMFIHRLDSKLQPELTPTHRIDDYSLLNYSGKAITSSLMPSLYNTNAWVLRLANPTSQEISLGKLELSKFKTWSFVDAREQAMPETDTIAPYDVVAIKLWR